MTATLSPEAPAVSPLDSYPEIMTRSEVAEVLRVTPKTLGNWASKGVGPRCIFITETCPRYRKGDLIDYLEGL